jgi:hypothetical protein
MRMVTSLSALTSVGEALHDVRDDGRRCDIGACFAVDARVMPEKE